jgi:superfamily I DNA/RNA helicase
MLTKVFGPPGSGKTTFLLDVVEKELANNTLSSQIGYFSFTRKAAGEARGRAIQKFPNLNAETDFPWFRTLHSLAYHCLGAGAKDLMSAEDYSNVCQGNRTRSLNIDAGRRVYCAG